MNWDAERDRLLAELERRGMGQVDTDAIVGPFEGWPSGDACRCFVACTEADGEQLIELLAVETDRLVVKLLIFATHAVPEPIFEATVRAGVLTQNPSFNKHFIWPCALLYGVPRVLETIAALESREEIDGAKARYWLTMPVDDMVFPDERGFAERRAKLIRQMKPPL